MPAPEIRASLIKLQLKAVDDLDAVTARLVRAAMTPGSAGIIDSASSVEWLPVETMLSVAEAVAKTLPPDAAWQFWRKTAQASFDTPLLKTVAQGAINLFRPSPLQAFRLLPKIQLVMMRNCGVLRVEEAGAHELRVIHSGAPPVMLRSLSWPPSTAAGYHAALDLLRVTGSTRTESIDLKRQEAVFSITWQ
jgi:hypothetical protein